MVNENFLDTHKKIAIVIASGVLLLMMALFGAPGNGQKKPKPVKPETRPTVDALLQQGKLEQLAISKDLQHYRMKKLVTAKASGTKIELADGSTVVLDGQLGLSELPRRCYVINGKARFSVKPGKDEFKVITRVGTIKVLGTDFEVELKPKAAKNKKAPPGDNGANLRLKVNLGRVGFLLPGRKIPRILKAGQNGLFVLGEVKRHGRIQVLGMAMRKRPGRIGIRISKRTAKMDALRAVAQFINGMKFTVEFNAGKTRLTKAVFNTSAAVDTAGMQFKLQPFDDKLMLCIGAGKIKRKHAVLRRNCKPRRGQGATFANLHKNVALAMIGARNNAIASLIHETAIEIYGDRIGQLLSGTFFPESFTVHKKGGQIIAAVGGEVLFD